MEQIAGKTAVVTGGTRGIGRAVVERLLAEGANVAFCGLHEETVAAALKELSAQYADRCYGAAVDVASAGAVEAFAANVEARFGGVDILVSNAAISVYRPAADLNPADWQRMLDINLTGPYLCLRAFAPRMKKRGAGDVINIGSLAGSNAFAGGAGYNASKFGLNGFTDAAMLDYRYEGIRVATVMPGSVNTDFGAAPGTKPRADWKIAPEDVADVAVCLLRMPRRTTIGRVEMRPSAPPRKQ